MKKTYICACEVYHLDNIRIDHMTQVWYGKSLKITQIPGTLSSGQSQKQCVAAVKKLLKADAACRFLWLERMWSEALRHFLYQNNGSFWLEKTINLKMGLFFILFLSAPFYDLRCFSCSFVFKANFQLTQFCLSLGFQTLQVDASWTCCASRPPSRRVPNENALGAGCLYQ